MARIIAATNQKGGVGKTTTSLALATGLHKKGFRVLAIDLDPQTNLSFSVGGETEEGPTVYELLKGEVRPLYAIQRSACVDLIASNIVLSGAELEFKGEGREYLLKKAIEPIRQRYDYIIIDTPPALGFLTVNAFVAADYLVIPMVADIFSLQGIAQLSDSIERVRRVGNPDLQIGGILLCRYDGRTVLGRRITETAAMVADQVGTRLYNTKIRTSIAIQEAQTNQISMFEYAPRSPGIRDYRAFINELLEEGV